MPLCGGLGRSRTYVPRDLCTGALTTELTKPLVVVVGIEPTFIAIKVRLSCQLDQTTRGAMTGIEPASLAEIYIGCECLSI